VTLTVVVLASGVTIGAVASSITNALKATGKAMSAGLKEIGAKLGFLLPGVIGQVVHFLPPPKPSASSPNTPGSSFWRS